MKLPLLGVLALGGLALAFYKFSRFDAEAAPYEVRLKDRHFELRRYPRLVVAQTAMGARNESFQRLFRFISGENSEAEKIPMTTPVLFDGEPGAQHTMSFIMPERLQNHGVPQPRSGRVQVDERGPTEVATLRFWSGMRAEAEARAIADLRSWMREHGLRPEGEPIVAYYDSPFIPAPLRRNEVMLRVQPGS